MGNVNGFLSTMQQKPASQAWLGRSRETRRITDSPRLAFSLFAASSAPLRFQFGEHRWVERVFGHLDARVERFGGVAG